MRTSRGRLSIVLGVLACTSLLVACGDDDDDSSGGATTATTESESAAPAATIEVVGVELPKPEQSKVSIAVSSVDPSALPIYLIDHANLDEQFGIDVSLSVFEGPAQAQQAVIAGQIDVMDSSAGPAFATAGTDDPFVVDFVFYDRLTDILVGAPDVETADDLRGQAVAVSSIGGLSYAGAVLGLQELGLTVDDVTITQVGGDSARLAALQAGSVGAAIQSPTKLQTLQDEGFNILVELKDASDGGFVNGLLVPTSFAEENPNTTLALVAMYQMAIAQINDGDPASYEAWAEISEQPLEDATAEIKDFVETGIRPLDGRCNATVLAFMKEILVAADPAATDVDPDATCSDEFVDRLDELGYHDALGIG